MFLKNFFMLTIISFSIMSGNNILQASATDQEDNMAKLPYDLKRCIASRLWDISTTDIKVEHIYASLQLLQVSKEWQKVNNDYAQSLWSQFSEDYPLSEMIPKEVLKHILKVQINKLEKANEVQVKIKLCGLYSDQFVIFTQWLSTQEFAYRKDILDDLSARGVL